MNYFSFFKRYLLGLLVLNLAACSTLQPVSIENAMQYSPPRGIDYGSLVEVKTLDKRTVKFRVTEITDDGLGGKQGFYRYEDMQNLRVDNPGKNKGETATYILSALGIIALIALIVNADNVTICTPSPCPVQ
ncbi:MAG: hypothetical protein IIB78_07825 [Proteobacteria bacterium]|nr:hypothetical protein [Pseudomonadota bacterium]MCH8057761.1 hypothetical protein [Pseudomonadota bacterium]